MARVTLKQVREHAASMPEGMTSLKKFMAITDLLSEEDFKYINGHHLVGTSDDKHYVYVELDFDDDDKGILIATAYNYEAVKQFAELSAEKFFNEFEGEWSSEFCKWHEENYPKSEFAFEVPLTRGYCDTSERSDTTFSSLDLEKAITEALDEHFECGKVYPWQLKEIACASDFGLTEEEFDIEINMACGY